MTRAALSIGCDNYQILPRLHGAARDATRIYELLLDQNYGEYDADASILVLSPTLAELRDAIRHVLFNSGSMDTFTFFFAGMAASTQALTTCVLQTASHGCFLLPHSGWPN